MRKSQNCRTNGSNFQYFFMPTCCYLIDHESSNQRIKIWNVSGHELRLSEQIYRIEDCLNMQHARVNPSPTFHPFQRFNSIVPSFELLEILSTSYKNSLCIYIARLQGSDLRFLHLFPRIEHFVWCIDVWQIHLNIINTKLVCARAFT